MNRSFHLNALLAPEEDIIKDHRPPSLHINPLLTLSKIYKYYYECCKKRSVKLVFRPTSFSALS